MPATGAIHLTFLHLIILTIFGSPCGMCGWCVWLTTLPLSCAKCPEILEASISWSPKGLSRFVQGLLAEQNIWWEVEITAPSLMELSPASCYFPTHPSISLSTVFSYTISLFSPYCETPSFTPTPTKKPTGKI